MGKRGHGGGGGGASDAKELKMFIKNRMWREHWQVLAAVGVIVVALFASAFLQFSNAKDQMHRLEISDDAQMTRVFRSGEPWVVLCTKPDDIIPDVFVKLPKRLAHKSYAGVLDCTQTLPSGKTVLARYGIKTSISPTVFTVANGGKPKQIFLNDLQTSKALARKVVEQTKKTAKEIQSTAHLELHCLSKPACVLLLRGKRFQSYEKQWIDQLMEEHRKLQFVWVDSTIIKETIKPALPKFVSGEHRAVLFKRQRDPEQKKTPVVTARAFRNDFELIPLRMFVEENLHADLPVLSKAPTLARRKTKTAPKPQQRTREERDPTTTSESASAPADEEAKGDEYYFPQQADPAETRPRARVEYEEEEVLDLDDDE